MKKSKSRNIDDLVNSIGLLIRDFRKQAEEQALPIFREEINYIITNRIESQNRIEYLLDSLLGYAQMGVGIKEFKRLNRYYSTINKKYSQEYENFYKEIAE